MQIMRWKLKMEETCFSYSGLISGFFERNLIPSASFVDKVFYVEENTTAAKSFWLE